MATLRKRGNSWVIDARDANGKRRVKSIGDVSKDIAEAKLRKKKNEKVFGYESNLKDSIAFKKYTAQYLLWYEEEFPDSYETKSSNVLQALEPVFGNLPLDKITTRHIIEFKKLRVKKHNNKPSTINRKLADLRGLLTRASIDGYLTPDDLQIEDVKEKESKPPKLYSEKEVLAIINEDQETSHWWLFLINTGLRVSEFYNLKTDNINAKAIHVVSTSKNRTKSGEWRYVPLTKIAKKCLKEFNIDSEYLVKRPYKLDSIKQRYRRVCERAGISSDKRGIHCLRHTFCSYLIMSGANLVGVQKIMGHGDIKTTMKYVHLTPNYLQEEVKNFSLEVQANPKLTVLD